MFLRVQNLMERKKTVCFLLVGLCLTVTIVCYRNNTLPFVCRKQLPKILIIGAPKCGTAALSSFLSYHPEIAIDGKRELNFFSDNYELGFDWYKDNLPCSVPGQVVIERSSNYIRIDKNVIQRVWTLNPEMKLILIVCEPVTRMISQFAMQLDHHKIQDTSFEETIFRDKTKIPKKSNFVVNSNYSFAISAWLRAFPLEQFHIVDGDNLKQTPWKEIKSVERFLGVKPYFLGYNFVYNATKGLFCFRDRRVSKRTHCLPSGKGRKHPEVSEKTKARLRTYFRSYNKIFFKQCGRTFNW